MLKNKLNYEPKLFLRCHCKNNNKFDNETQVWRAAFQPLPHSKLVATCGGNSVVIIDCEKQKVIARYIDKDGGEMLTALAWGYQGQLIAVAGSMAKIILLSLPTLSVKSIMTGAHTGYINSMLFLSKNHLVSCSYDKRVKIWDLEENTKKKQCVYETNTQLELLNLLLCNKTLLISAEDGLIFWNLPLAGETRGESFTKARLPKNNCHVDGMAKIDDDRIVIRQSKRNKLSVINLKKTLLTSDGNLVDLVIETELQWSETPINYFNICCVDNLIACGDDDGQVLLYHVSDKWQKADKAIEPDRTLKWPKIEEENKENPLVDSKKAVLVNEVAMSDDKQFLVAVTSNNLVCFWKIKTK